MKRLIAFLAAAAALGAFSATSGRCDEESDRAALQAELDALLGEILESSEDGAPAFDTSIPPDLVLLTTAEVAGESSPCG